MLQPQVSLILLVSSVLLLSCVRLFATPWTAARQASLSMTSSQSLLKLMSVESVIPSNHLILCRPCLQSFPALAVLVGAAHIPCPFKLLFPSVPIQRPVGQMSVAVFSFCPSSVTMGKLDMCSSGPCQRLTGICISSITLTVHEPFPSLCMKFSSVQLLSRVRLFATP